MAFDPEESLTVKLTIAEWNVVLETLQLGAYKTVAMVIRKITEQAAASQAAATINKPDGGVGRRLRGVPSDTPPATG